ncbi:phytanoyl-CoA hydroxylase [Colletotrichum sojae]|uniref:Phytanoyl-CoA hydroxylase n=1 Tax=Colletotrichum sojae TaxID=2175907 RepID=A0A8H6J9Y6_9PEZI|nr:phytanoyl-CoA hydroxylase [Colletotrichum sojae]
MPHAESPTPAAPPTISGVQLHVNDDLLAPEEVELLIPSHPSEDLEVLRRRYRENGCLLLKGLLAREDVLAARESYFTSLEPSGVIKPGTTPREGIFDDAKSPADYPGIGAGSVKNSRPGESDRSALFADQALRAHTEEWYAGSEDGRVAGFSNHPALKQFVARFTGWGDDNTLAVKRSLLRNNTPGNRAIGVHYDQSFMRYGEPTSVTAWVPMGDVRLEGGGLIYLQNGEQLGEEIENEFTAMAKAKGMSDEETRNAFNSNMMSTGFLCEGPAEFGRKYGRKWLVTAYEAGDVVFHTPHMIHASTKNYDPDGRIRLGTDLRFVDKSRPWDTRWNKHYSFNDGV